MPKIKQLKPHVRSSLEMSEDGCDALDLIDAQAAALDRVRACLLEDGLLARRHQDETLGQRRYREALEGSE